MNAPDNAAVLERHLLLQLGDRLKRLRKAQGLGTVAMAQRAGISRTTLSAVEAGDQAVGAAASTNMHKTPTVAILYDVPSDEVMGGEMKFVNDFQFFFEPFSCFQIVFFIMFF